MNLFETLCEAYASHKDELDPVQMFYFLRGTLYAWCLDHGESVFDMEGLFMTDIHTMARQERS